MSPYMMAYIINFTKLFFGSHLDSQREIKPEQVQVKEFKWTNFGLSGVNFEIVINSDYNSEAPIAIFIERKRVHVFNNKLLKGENLIRGRTYLLDIYNNDTSLFISSISKKQQGQLTIKSEDLAKNSDDYNTIYRKVIDMPNINFEIKQNDIIGKDGGYLTITNLGNIPKEIVIDKDRSWCGIDVFFPSFELAPQESKQIPVELWPLYSTGTGESDWCKLESGESGITHLTIRTGFFYFKEPIDLGEINVKFKNQ